MDDLIIEKRFPTAQIAIGVVLVAAGMALYSYSNRQDQTVYECGDLIERPAQLTEGTAPTFQHDTYCQLSGIVQTDRLLTMGNIDGQTSDPLAKYAGVRYFTKLVGANVVIALSAARPDVRAHYDIHQNLLGYQFSGVGRLFDPQQESGYKGMGRAFADKLGLSGELWVFDLEDQPEAQ